MELAADGQASYDFRIAGTADWQWTDDELAGALDDGPAGPVVAVHSGSLALTTAPGHDALRELLASAVDTATVSYDPNFRPLLMGKTSSRSPAFSAPKKRTVPKAPGEAAMVSSSRV